MPGSGIGRLLTTGIVLPLPVHEKRETLSSPRGHSFRYAPQSVKEPPNRQKQVSGLGVSFSGNTIYILSLFVIRKFDISLAQQGFLPSARVLYFTAQCAMM